MVFKVKKIVIDEPDDPGHAAEPCETEEPVAPWELSEAELGTRVLPQVSILNGTPIRVLEQVKFNLLPTFFSLGFFTISNTCDDFKN